VPHTLASLSPDLPPGLRVQPPLDDVVEPAEPPGVAPWVSVPYPQPRLVGEGEADAGAEVSGPTGWADGEGAGESDGEDSEEEEGEAGPTTVLDRPSPPGRTTSAGSAGSSDSDRPGTPASEAEPEIITGSEESVERLLLSPGNAEWWSSPSAARFRERAAARPGPAAPGAALPPLAVPAVLSFGRSGGAAGHCALIAASSALLVSDAAMAETALRLAAACLEASAAQRSALAWAYGKRMQAAEAAAPRPAEPDAAAEPGAAAEPEWPGVPLSWPGPALRAAAAAASVQPSPSALAVAGALRLCSAERLADYETAAAALEQCLAVIPADGVEGGPAAAAVVESEAEAMMDEARHTSSAPTPTCAVDDLTAGPSSCFAHPATAVSEHGDGGVHDQLADLRQACGVALLLCRTARKVCQGDPILAGRGGGGRGRAARTIRSAVTVVIVEALQQCAAPLAAMGPAAIPNCCLYFAPGLARACDRIAAGAEALQRFHGWKSLDEADAPGAAHGAAAVEAYGRAMRRACAGLDIAELVTPMEFSQVNVLRGGGLCSCCHFMCPYVGTVRWSAGGHADDGHAPLPTGTEIHAMAAQGLPSVSESAAAIAEAEAVTSLAMARAAEIAAADLAPNDARRGRKKKGKVVRRKGKKGK